jgi:CheY-like chemotaxis protein
MRRSCILHVDDDPDDRLLVRHAAKQAGVSLPLLSLENGEQAMDYLSGRGEYANRAEFPLPCVILLDIKMNGVSGFDVLKWIRDRSEFDDVVVIIFSGSRLDGDIQKALALRANSFVAKPTGCDSLINFIRAVQDYWLTFHEFGSDSNCRTRKAKLLPA